MAKLIYILLYSSLMFSSLNAEWKMFSSKDGTFIYEDETGTFMKLKTDKKQREQFVIVPLKAASFHSNGREFFKNTQAVVK